MSQHQFWRGTTLQRGHKYLTGKEAVGRRPVPRIKAMTNFTCIVHNTGMVVRDMRPFNIVNNPGFRAFVKVLQPGYVLPTPKTTHKYLDAMYDQRKGEFKAMFAPLSLDTAGTAAAGITACLVTDAWGSRNGRSY